MWCGETSPERAIADACGLIQWWFYRNGYARRTKRNRRWFFHQARSEDTVQAVLSNATLDSPKRIKGEAILPLHPSSLSSRVAVHFLTLCPSFSNAVLTFYSRHRHWPEVHSGHYDWPHCNLGCCQH